MDKKKTMQNYQTILDSEISKAEAGDQRRKQLFEFTELVSRSERISAEYPRVISSRDKEELSAVWAYSENKRVLIEIAFLETKMAILQNRINKLIAKKQLDESEQTKLQNYHSDFMFAQMQVLNLQKHRSKEEIERINEAIKHYVNDASGLDLSLEEIKKFIASLSTEEKKKFISNYANAGERFMIFTGSELTSAQSFGE